MNMKAFLIDPSARTIEQIELSRDDKDLLLPAMYAALNCRLVDVACIRALPGNDVWIDDEGLYVADQSFFYLRGNDGPYAGRGLVLSCDDSGEERSATCTLDQLRGVVAWVRALA
jgi:hypothetical protein